MTRALLRSLSVLAVSALLAACGGSSPKLDKLSANDVVLAFGDSLTFGTGAATDDSYPAILERAIGRKVANAGVPGETSEEGLQRLPLVLDEVKPKLLILCHGGNDFLRRLDEKQAGNNVRAMIVLARDRGIPVILLATPKPGLPPSIPAFYGEIATELRLPLDDVIIKSVLLDASLRSDTVHPNGKGYARMAAAVEKVLRKSGAI
jgi:lysophospholipase L1-like esterase